MSKVSVAPIFSHTFTDPDELEAIFRHQQDFHAVQLEMQPLECHLLHLKLDGADFFFFKASQNSIRLWGSKQPGILTFEFLMSPSPTAALLSHGTVIGLDTLYGFAPNREVDLVIPAHALLGSLHIKQEIFEDCKRILGRNDLDDRFLSTNHVQSPATFAPIQRYLRELYGLVQQRSPFLHQSHLSKLLLEDYLPLLIEAIPPNDYKSAIARKQLPRSSLVRQAEAYMLSHLDQPITLQDLCKALHTSKTPLTEGFQAVLGVSPMAYLKVLRLYAIHNALKAADPTTTKVADLAHQFGFWHLGRLSQDYRQMFGQLPSATLHQ